MRGVSISVPLRATDPAGESRDVRIAYVFGDVHADALATEIETTAPPATPSQPVSWPRDPTPAFAAPHARAEALQPGAPATSVVRKIVRTARAPSPPASARGAYGAFMALAIALLAFRPLVRQAARP